MKFYKRKVMKFLPFVMFIYSFYKLSEAFITADRIELKDKIINGINGIIR